MDFRFSYGPCSSWVDTGIKHCNEGASTVSIRPSSQECNLYERYGIVSTTKWDGQNGMDKQVRTLDGEETTNAFVHMETHTDMQTHYETVPTIFNYMKV